MAEALISLGRAKDNTGSLTSKLLTASIADKFFTVGALSCVIGIGYHGVHLWLMLKGKLPPYQHYMALRESHAYLQLFMFFGLFILGFVFQAAGKIIGGTQSASPRVLFLPLVIVASLTIFFIPGLNNLSRGLLTLPFLVAFIHVLAVVRSAPKPNWRATVLMLLGLVGFNVAPWTSFFLPFPALVSLNLSVTMVVFGAGEQFVVNFAGGKRLQGTAGTAIVGLLSGVFTIGLLFILFPKLQTNSTLTTCWLSLLTLATLSYTWHTELFALPMKLSLFRDTPVRIAIVTGYIWLLTGTTLGVIYGAIVSDGLLHIIALGWGATIVFAVSGQIVTSMSGTKYFKPERTKLALLLWQPVIIDRGLLPVISPSWSFPWLTSVLASIVVSWWALGIILAERRIIRAALKNISPHLI
ncbi:MAG: NnrS family protein [bacterium]|nr:NnrS family protein [bacterium]